jgi:hypothetical protein
MQDLGQPLPDASEKPIAQFRLSCGCSFGVFMRLRKLCSPEELELNCRQLGRQDWIKLLSELLAVRSAKCVAHGSKAEELVLQLWADAGPVSLELKWVIGLKVREFPGVVVPKVHPSFVSFATRAEVSARNVVESVVGSIGNDGKNLLLALRGSLAVGNEEVLII